MKTAVVAGATGLVGSQLCRQLAASESGFDRVVALTRRPLDFSLPGLVEQQVDFEQLDQLDLGRRVDAAFCTLGTTIKAAGSREAFRLVDYDYVVAFARFAKRSGATAFGLLTSVASTPTSPYFYLQVKGQSEKAVEAVGFPSLSIFRPSVLIGERVPPRKGERLGAAVGNAIRWALVGGLRKYRGIPAEQVAAGMAASALQASAGTCVFHYDDIVKIAAQSGPMVNSKS